MKRVVDVAVLGRMPREVSDAFRGWLDDNTPPLSREVTSMSIEDCDAQVENIVFEDGRIMVGEDGHALRREARVTTKTPLPEVVLAWMEGSRSDDG